MTDCDLCGRDIDPNNINTIIMNPPVEYRHPKCDGELSRRDKSNLCLTCGETTRGLDRESCSNCGVNYCEPDRKYMNF